MLGLVLEAYKKHFSRGSLKLTRGGGAVNTSSCSTYLDQFANEGLLAADASVRPVTGSNQLGPRSGMYLGPGCLMVWSSVWYPANVRRWPSILDPWQSPWHPTLLLWWCHAPQRTDSNTIWEEFQLSFLAIAPLGALYSLLVLCPEPGPRIGIIFNLHTESSLKFFLYHGYVFSKKKRNLSIKGLIYLQTIRWTVLWCTGVKFHLFLLSLSRAE